MPRGGEYSDGPTVQSDNAIESGENKVAGTEPGSSEVDRSGKAAPLPEGMSEMKDETLSGGGSQNLAGRDNAGTTGGGSGKGHDS